MNVKRVAALILCSLAGCSSGGSDGSDSSDDPATSTRIASEFLSPDLRGDADISLPETQSYSTIDGSVGNDTILQGLGSSRIRPGTEVSANETRIYVYGYRDPETDQIFLTDTNFVLEDLDGRTPGTSSIVFLSDDFDTVGGTGARVSYDTGAMNAASNYDYARLFTVGGFDDVGDYTGGYAMLGATTAIEDLPSPAGGTITYFGDVLHLYRVSSSTSFLRDTATVTANFADQLVDATLALNITGADRIESLDMVMVENGFSGGRQRIRDGVLIVTNEITGGALGSDAGGFFFGPDAAEVGGFVSIGGTDVSIESYFLAD